MTNIDFDILNNSTPENDQGNPEPGSFVDIGKPPTIVDPFDPEPIVKNLTAEFDVKIANMELQVDGLEVVDQKSCDRGVEMIGQLKKISRAVDKRRVEKKAPYLKVGKAIDGFAKPIKDRLAKLRAAVEGKTKPWFLKIQQEKEEAARKERERAAKIAADLNKLAKKKAEESFDTDIDPTPPPIEIHTEEAGPVTVKTEEGNVTLKTKLDFEILDVKAMPDAMFKMRKKQLEGAIGPWIRAQINAGVESIPGVRIFEKTVLS